MRKEYLMAILRIKLKNYNEKRKMTINKLKRKIEIIIKTPLKIPNIKKEKELWEDKKFRKILVDIAVQDYYEKHLKTKSGIKIKELRE